MIGFCHPSDGEKFDHGRGRVEENDGHNKTNARTRSQTQELPRGLLNVAETRSRISPVHKNEAAQINIMTVPISQMAVRTLLGLLLPSAMRN